MSVRGIILSVIFLSGLAILFFSISREGTDREKSKAIVGLDAPELTLKDATGRIYNLNEMKGSVVFINFWASWCAPCKEEMPSIQSLYNSFKDNGQFRMLTVLYNDDYQKAANYMKENNFQLPVFIDADGKTAKAYGVKGVPETYIIDKKGILREKVLGPARWSSPKAISLMSDLIRE